MNIPHPKSTHFHYITHPNRQLTLKERASIESLPPLKLMAQCSVI
jgi:hypothetical protein